MVQTARSLVVATLQQAIGNSERLHELMRALEGATDTRFDRDGHWRANLSGDPRCEEAGTFDGEALRAGALAIAHLSVQLPVGDALRDALPDLLARLQARLANPELLLFGGFPRDGEGIDLSGPTRPAVGHEAYRGEMIVDTGGAVNSGHYAYFRPARLESAEEHALLDALCWVAWVDGPFPWTSPYRVYRVVVDRLPALCARIRSTPLPAGAFEADPRASAPEAVAALVEAHGLSEEAATLYLQLGTLCDCSDVFLRLVDGWSATQHKRIAEELVKKGLVVAERRPRGGRAWTLPGAWETFRPPNPGIEREKLALYEVVRDGSALGAPLGRMAPLLPVHELFARRVDELARRAPSKAGVSRADDWLAAIRAAPDDDEPRLVYADWLTERGDARGELITLQCQIGALERSALERGASTDPSAAEELDALRAHEKQLLRKVGAELAGRIQPLVESYRFDRGFITSITMRPADFVKRAALLDESLPLLDELVFFFRGGVGKIPDKQLDALAGCPLLARIRRLDFTIDHYPGAHAFARLLKSKYLGELEVLRLGYHRKGSGIGRTGAKVITASTRLSKLRELSLPGQRLDAGGLEILLGATNLPALELLGLAYNELTDEHVELILAHLDHFPRLRRVVLANDLGPGATPSWILDGGENRISPTAAERLAARLAR